MQKLLNAIADELVIDNLAPCELRRLARSLDGINSLYHEELILAAFGIDEKGESNDA
jgi:hypothetical protein